MKYLGWAALVLILAAEILFFHGPKTAEADIGTAGTKLMGTYAVSFPVAAAAGGTTFVRFPKSAGDSSANASSGAQSQSVTYAFWAIVGPVAGDKIDVYSRNVPGGIMTIPLQTVMTTVDLSGFASGIDSMALIDSAGGGITATVMGMR